MRWIYPLLLAVLVPWLLACSSDETSEPPLRVLMPPSLNAANMADGEETQIHHLAFIRRFAEEHKRPLEIIPVDSYAELIPKLLGGEGDVIVGNLTVSESRKKQVNFTTPLYFVHELVVGRKGETPDTPQAMGGRRLAVHASDAYHETLQTLQKRRFQPEFTIETVADNLTNEALLDGVIEGRYDLTVIDSNLADELLTPRPNLAIAFDLGSVRPIAWATPPESKALHAQLNDFLNRLHLAGDEPAIHTGDLDAIKKRQVLRVLTRNNAATYYIWRGQQLGFEYELAKRFANQHDLRLEIVVPPSRDELVPWLLEGRGDIIAASLSIDDEYLPEGAVFSRHYNQINELIVGRKDEQPFDKPTDLVGRTLVLRPSSSYWRSAEALRDSGIDLTLEAAPESMETEEIIAAVATGEFDLTMADSHIVDIEMTWRDDIQALYAFEELKQHGWLLRNNNKALLKAVNTFLQAEYRGEFFNVTYKKYFENTKRISSHAEQRADRGNGISPYDEIVKKYADEYGFDWRILIAQMYQESRFNPGAKSWMGAQGLMQVLPRTAKEHGISGALSNPETGIKAGVVYLDWLRRRFEPELPIGERTWLALAAYNAGVGHVRDARTLAASQGLNPDIWFDNVEKAMLLLSKRKHAKNARHGYVRGEEPVNYVRSIQERYLAYLELAASMSPL